MKAMRSATSRAKPISWVTTTIVVPDLQGEVLHHGEDLPDQLGVERGGRLVEEHDLGLHGQGARDGDPLLLAAGELDRVLVPLFGDADLLQKAHPELLGLPRWASS